MKTRHLIAIGLFIACLFGGICWSAWYYSDKANLEKARADSAEQQAKAANAVTANVIQAVNIINTISEANQHAKQQIALESQRAENDIKAAVADDDCAVRVVPAGAVKRMHEYANGLRAGSGSSVTSQPDG